MQINIDSPTTVTHQYPQLTSPVNAGGSLLSRLAPYILAAVLGGGLGAGSLLPWALSGPSESPSIEDTDTTRRIEFEVWRPAAGDSR